MADGLPGDADGILDEAQLFADAVTANTEEFGFTPQRAGGLQDKIAVARLAITAQTAAHQAYRTTTTTKTTTVNAAEKEFRALRAIAKAQTTLTPEQRTAARLDMFGADTDPGDGLQFAPLSFVEQAGIHKHEIYFFMPSEDVKSTKKPKGVFGCRIFCKIGGTASTNLKDYFPLTIDTKSSYGYLHDAANAGQTAHYICLWEDTDGEQSPQSEVFSLVIT